MFFISRNNKEQASSLKNNVQEGIAKKLVERFIRWQRKTALKMQERTERFSLRAKLIMLILFCLLVGGYCINILAQSFFYKQPILFSAAFISKPDHVQQSGEDRTTSSNIIKIEHERIQRFKRYMDSLARSPTGKEVYDSIIYMRPQLMDSVTTIEQLYKSQTEN